MWNPFARRKAPMRNKARDAPAARTVSTGKLRPFSWLRADATLKGNEAIYAAVSRISNTMASMPLHLYKGYERQDAHPLERLVAFEPNVNFTPFSFIRTMEVLRNTEGNCYALIVPDKLGQPMRLDILNPCFVKPYKHTETKEIWYSITLDDGKSYQVPGCTLIALQHMSANGVDGIRPLDVLCGSLDYDRTVKELALNQLDGVNHGIMLTVPNSALGEEERAQLIDDLISNYEKSNQKIVVLEGGLSATTFSQSPVDSQLLDVERITRNRVATVYNLPPHMLGDYTDTSFSTNEQQMEEFLQLTIIPIVVQWEQELNRKLLTPQDYTDGYRFRFDTEELVRADIQATANKHQMAIRGGWMRPNEVRERDHLPPDPHGNELMASRDLIPLAISVDKPELLLGGTAAQGGETK